MEGCYGDGNYTSECNKIYLSETLIYTYQGFDLD